MELMKDELAEFIHKDITFFVRTKANIRDRISLDVLTVEALKSKTVAEIPRIGKEIVKMFICGWRGVTLNGQPTAYSYELLETGFPAAMANELMPALCRFVAANVDILKSNP